MSSEQGFFVIMVGILIGRVLTWYLLSKVPPERSEYRRYIYFLPTSVSLAVLLLGYSFGSKVPFSELPFFQPPGLLAVFVGSIVSFMSMALTDIFYMWITPLPLEVGEKGQVTSHSIGRSVSIVGCGEALTILICALCVYYAGYP